MKNKLSASRSPRRPLGRQTHEDRLQRERSWFSSKKRAKHGSRGQRQGNRLKRARLAEDGSALPVTPGYRRCVRPQGGLSITPGAFGIRRTRPASDGWGRASDQLSTAGRLVYASCLQTHAEAPARITIGVEQGWNRRDVRTSAPCGELFPE